MSNLIPLEDAARMLGLSVDKLNEMRSNSEIFGYKDGTSWKFKMQELERVADEFDITINTNSAAAADEIVDLDDDEFDLSLDDDDDDALDFDLEDSSADLVQADSVDEDIVVIEDDDDDIVSLVDDEDEIVDLAADDDILDLGDDDDEVVSLADDDDVVDLADDDDFDIKLDDDDDDQVLDLGDDDDEPVVAAATDEVVELADDDDDFDLGLDDESSEMLDLAAESKEEVVAADSSDLLDLDDEAQGELKFEDDSADILDLADEEPAAQEPEDLSFGSSDISLAADNDDSGDLLLDDEPSKGDPSTGKLLGGDDDDGDLLLSEDDLFEDDLEIQDSHEDSIDLSSDFEDSDLIMEDSDSSAEMVGEDSGLLLEDSAEFEMSGGGLMELAGADDDEMIVLDDPASSDAATELGDDDFNLTPLEEVVDEESSGSQIIALEDSDMFSEDSAATLLSPSDELEAEPMLADEGGMGVDDFGAFDTGGVGMAAGMAITPGNAGALPEQPYTVWQVLSLGAVLLLLGTGGMIGYDLARNLWLPADQTISSGVLPMILDLLGMRT